MRESILVFAAVLLDRISKLWAKNILLTLPGRAVDVIPGVVEFRYVENTGAAFSLLSGKQEFFIILTVLMVAVMIFYLVRYRNRSGVWMRMGMAAIMGGALGNFIDRLFCGHVIDFINPTFMDFAVFNVADIFITCGTIIFVLSVLFTPQLAEGKYAKR